MVNMAMGTYIAYRFQLICLNKVNEFLLLMRLKTSGIHNDALPGFIKQKIGVLAKGIKGEKFCGDHSDWLVITLILAPGKGMELK